VMLLWNWLVPALFGWPPVTFWQAIALLALCRILFGGSGIGGGVRSNVRRQVRQRMEGHWEQMTLEERDRLRQGLHDRSGRTTPLDSNPSA
jgi:hypothetical protein